MPVTDGENVDVLIIGAGPTGLMTALWMAELGIKTRILDDKGTRALNGRTDGFHVRTAEIWDSFGLYGVLQQHGVRFDEWCLWAPGDDGRLSRQKRQPMMGLDVSRMSSYTMHQGNTEAALVAAIRQRSGPEVERGLIPVSMALDDSLVDDLDAHPLTVQLQYRRREDLVVWQTNAHSTRPDGSIQPERGGIDAAVGSSVDDTVPIVSGVEGTTKTIHAKYIVGSDGAHSWVRRQLGFQMVGSSTNAVWGVIDAVLYTDFPDFRRHCTILTQQGTILSVPRENGMTRLYVQLPESFSEQASSSSTTTDPGTGKQIIAAARQSLHPYTLEYSYCDWWTIYRVGQRVSDRFAHRDRIFLGGDAVHTHTPKGGQGMNVSLQDAFNLGWKLAGVVHGQLHRSVLATYEAERQPVAQDLINLDTNMARVLASKTMSDPLEVRRVYEQVSNYGTGANICYAPNILVWTTRKQQGLAAQLKLGMRFPSHPVLKLSNSVPVESQALLRSDGRWRLLVFGGDVTNPAQLQRVNILGEKLSGLTQRFKPVAPQQKTEAGKKHFIEVLLFYYGRVEQMELHDFHPTYSRVSNNLFDYDRIFSDPPASLSAGRFGSAHEQYGISVGRGCVVATRPDQCVGWLGELEDDGPLGDYFGAFMRE